MARSFHRRNTLEAMSEINVTPLIDLAFALLIIFMITAPLLEQSIDIDLPVESPRTQQENPPAVQEISIDAEGRYFWGNETVDLEQLDRYLELEALAEDPAVLQVRADASLPYQSVIDLIDLIKKHNLRKLSLETRGR
ncbi:MAG: ExbD/TolR family protein [Opitutales bacterium]